MELVVVTAIIGTIMSIVFTSQSTFNKTLILKNTAYDIALTLRNAQTYGLGSRVQGTPLNVGYGVHFNKGADSFTLFADTYPNTPSCHSAVDASSPDAQPGDCVYTASDQKVTDYKIGNGILVSDLCKYVNYAWSCGGTSSVDVVFARPNTETFIRADSSAYPSVCIILSSPQGGTRAVKVSSAGQIVANETSCI